MISLYTLKTFQRPKYLKLNLFSYFILFISSADMMLMDMCYDDTPMAWEALLGIKYTDYWYFCIWFDYEYVTFKSNYYNYRIAAL